MPVIYWVHDFVASAPFHSGLMDAAAMGKGIVPDNRGDGRSVGEIRRMQIGGPFHLLRVEETSKGIDVAAFFEIGDNSFHLRAARPFANSIDGAFGLPRATLERRQRIGNGQAEIVMRMRGKDDVWLRLNLGNDMPKHIFVLLGLHIAERIRQIDRRGSSLDRYANGVN